MKLHTDFFEKLHEKFPTITEDAVIEGFYKFLKDITIESNIDYPSEIDISSVTGTSIKFTDARGNTIGIIEPVKKENFNHGIQLRVDDQVLGLFISDEYIATAIAPTPVPIQQGGNPKSIVTLDSFKQLAIYTLEELGLSFTEGGFLEIDKGDDSLSSIGYVKKQLDKLKQEIIAMIPTNDEIVRLAALPKGSIIIWTSKDIPNGWAICDGTNGTPDMRDKFIIGASNKRDINVIGGSSSSSSSSNSEAYISNHFHYWGYESGDNCGVFLTSGGLAGAEWSDNNCCDVSAKGLLPSKELIEKSFSNTDSGNIHHNVLGATMVRWNGNDDGSDQNSVPIEQGGMYKRLNTITTLGISNEAENESESVVESLPPFYSVYYIMKITGNATETPKPPTPEIPDTPDTPDTPDYTTPEGVVEGVLTPYTLKIRFKDSWYSDPGKFGFVSYRFGLKEATKIVDDVVYFIFTEEEALALNGVDALISEFVKYEPVKEPNKDHLTHNSSRFILKFFDTIMDDVVNIWDINPYDDYIPIGSAYV